MPNAFPGLIPDNEGQRLDALSQYEVLFQPNQPLFNEFVSILARLFAVPIALVSLVGAEEVVFAGNAGLQAVERTSRSASLCSVAVLHEGITVFEDLAQHPCELVNMDAVRGLQLGFYAGRPLRSSDGSAVGTLCVIDRKPRLLSLTEQVLLDYMGQVASDILLLEASFANDQTLSRELWQRVRQQIQFSLTRMDTLAELSKHENDQTTDAARAYRQSSQEEALLVVQAMQKELKQALASISR
ncbi:GAF domain-containing protein [Microvirga sp. STR05]|uniref:GAF domain-containing protein n=1 Tax=Hymenobacter duratus TaxID=2771356 RepID=A0ABR8JCK3_9BACT|nr:GAF domain-containing protein [Hymenobacter duratus]MBD2713420.1 GAF domain-containing protein [Hymenobacter duratus]MBR7948322.1 GAF domain-containing protein [Microvirga sp. STR05]